MQSVSQQDYEGSHRLQEILLKRQEEQQRDQATTPAQLRQELTTAISRQEYMEAARLHSLLQVGSSDRKADAGSGEVYFPRHGD